MKSPLLVTIARAVLRAMAQNPNFPSPDPPLATVEAAAEALAEAEAATRTRAMTTVAVRNEKRRALATLLSYLKDYVQRTADADVEHGASIIESAGMSVKRPRHLPLRVFAAKPGRNSGWVELVAPKAPGRASYLWAYSIDGMKTWVILPTTVKASTTVEGLPRGSTVYFRYRVTTKDGEGDWSEPVSILVV